MRNRAIASIALAATLAMGLSGCNFFSPQRTLEKYDPSDGVGANLGDLDVRNAMVITEDGDRGTLVVSITNLTAEAAELEVEYASDAPDAVDGRVTFTVGVPAQSIVTTSDGSEQIVLEDIDAPAGSLFPIFFQSGDAPGQELQVPVLDGTLEQYVPLLPSPSPTPTPTPTPVITPTPIPTPTDGTEPEGEITDGEGQ